MVELIQWINQEGFFGLESAKRQHGKIAPAEWWKLYGKGTPILQQLAIRIHSKKRNRLEHKKLHDFVYVKYNNMLKNRRDSNAAYDLISLEEIDDSNEWLTGQMADERFFDDDGNLTWNVVAEASGAGEVRRTRSSQPSSSKPASSKRTLTDEDSEEDQLEEDEPYVIEVDDTSDGFGY
ncbi:uncharacterized protein LOC118481839 [Helianthus annuus]|uniref:uncharacterized protein LOC118481839 n=1 Tax=Helianthus annuus TaxID=4232 RepID=UPI001652F2F7|nr:uncharacterized protein LOC118481839 [Helianthus annuus]